ncbi:hypothetical protein BDV19DRAFT_394231 [Aspergillus venezuelensis]
MSNAAVIAQMTAATAATDDVSHSVVTTANSTNQLTVPASASSPSSSAASKENKSSQSTSDKTPKPASGTEAPDGSEGWWCVARREAKIIGTPISGRRDCPIHAGHTDFPVANIAAHMASSDVAFPSLACKPKKLRQSEAHEDTDGLFVEERKGLALCLALKILIGSYMLTRPKASFVTTRHNLART